ncbi:MAG: DUF72 domain-containing protein [Gemmatimonadota bacterium]
MKVLTGTSGWAFKEWKGSFYPADLPDSEMLAWYATQFPIVEINNTFYRLPKEQVLADWAAQVPEGFRIALKASQRITHFARLRAESAASPLEFLLHNIRSLGSRLGPVLFQTPPNLQKDLGRLREFLALLPVEGRFTIEFRHRSWFDDEVVELLRTRAVALCAIDQEEFASPLIPTAPWGYLRLHRFDYDDRALETWARRVRDEPWEDAYVFFKHDYTPFTGPAAVAAFTRALG